MEIFTLLETLEDILEKSRKIERWIKTGKMGKRRETKNIGTSSKWSRWYNKRSRK